MNNVQKQMEEIRKQFGISRQDLDNLGMDEFDYLGWYEKMEKNYIKGLLFGRIKPNVDLEQISENIINTCKITPDKSLHQNIIIGEISDDCLISQHRILDISQKIANFISLLQKVKKS